MTHNNKWNKPQRDFTPNEIRSSSARRVRFIKNRVCEFRDKLDRSLNLRLDQEDIESPDILSYLKVISTITDLMQIEIKFEEGKKTIEVPKNFTAEDCELLEKLKEKWLLGPDSNQRPSG